MTLAESRELTSPAGGKPEFTAAEIGALAHLYRGEVYRSTVWRTRLDSSTNWAVVTTGIALSATYSNAEASPLPMVLVGLLVTVFLLFEARRYRYFNVWRARARLLETDFYAPMLSHEGARRFGLGRVARQGLSQSELSHQLRPRDRTPPAANIRLYIRHPGHRVLRQACYPPFAADYACRGLATGRHRPNPRRTGGCRRSPISFELGVVRACHLSYRGCVEARAEQPDRDGMSKSSRR